MNDVKIMMVKHKKCSIIFFIFSGPSTVRLELETALTYNSIQRLTDLLETFMKSPAAFECTKINCLSTTSISVKQKTNHFYIRITSNEYMCFAL